jgi:hypothetical protein
MESKDRNSLGWILIGLYPFFFFGPITVLLGYPFPPPAWRWEVPFQTVLAIAGLLPAAIGFSLGWWKRFPLWSYVYFCQAVLFFIIACGTLLDGRTNWSVDLPAMVGLLLLFVLLALLVYWTCRDLPLRDLFADIRRDWTRLSLGLIILPAMFFGSIDHEEDPILTIFVIGPGLVLLLTALLALLANSKEHRALILAAGMLLTILVRLPSGKGFYLFFWLVTAAIVFFPFLLQLLPQPHKGTPPV